MEASTKNTATLKQTSISNWKILAILLIGAFMALLDVTIVNVALPSLQHGIHAGSSTLEWVVSGYALAFGLVLILSGRIGDNIGHRWTFLTGLTIFTMASLSCSLAQNSTEIIISRLIQGMGAGAFVPAITSFIQILFTGKDRSKAFGMYGAIVGLSTALGPLFGGLLIQGGGAHLGWRLVFLVNVPIGVVALPLAMRLLPHDEARANRRSHNLDPVGISLLSAGLLLLLIPLVEGQQVGWPLWTYLCMIAAVPVFIGLWFWEVHLEKEDKEPLIATYLLRELSFAGGSLLALVYFASFTSIFFILSIFWQEGLARSALATGLMIVPFAIGSMIAASQSDKISIRIGRWILVIGCALMAIGLSLVELLLHRGGVTISALTLTAPLFIAGIGNGLFIAPNQDFILKSVKRQDAGSASGIVATAQRIGTAVGIAAIGTIFFSSIKITRQPQAIAHAFSHGAQIALLVNISLSICALILVFSLPKTTAAPQPAAADDA
jgi:EmrB/QacA subfamily drug resistance transporter